MNMSDKEQKPASNPTPNPATSVKAPSLPIKETRSDGGNKPMPKGSTNGK